jgi:septum formation protein
MPDRLPKLILASRSPRRCELLSQAGYSFEVRPPRQAAERELGQRSGGVVGGETPIELVARLAFQKAADVARYVRSGLIVGCDTVAECGGRILGKPADEHHARQMLRELSGREHRVLSGLCLWRAPEARSQVRVAETTLRMDQLSDEQLHEYLASGAWQGKAGAFGYQDRLGWVHVIEGSESNVVGLPMELLAEMLAHFETENRQDTESSGQNRRDVQA